MPLIPPLKRILSFDDEEIQEKISKCPICQDWHIDPITFSCGHSICELHLIQNAASLDKCPQCRVDIQIFNGQGEKLNFKVNHVLKEWMMLILGEEYKKKCLDMEPIRVSQELYMRYRKSTRFHNLRKKLKDYFSKYIVCSIKEITDMCPEISHTELMHVLCLCKVGRTEHLFARMKHLFMDENISYLMFKILARIVNPEPAVEIVNLEPEPVEPAPPSPQIFIGVSPISESSVEENASVSLEEENIMSAPHFVSEEDDDWEQWEKVNSEFAFTPQNMQLMCELTTLWKHSVQDQFDSENDPCFNAWKNHYMISMSQFASEEVMYPLLPTLDFGEHIQEDTTMSSDYYDDEDDDDNDDEIDLFQEEEDEEADQEVFTPSLFILPDSWNFNNDEPFVFDFVSKKQRKE
jgi:hypothetical protein